MARVGKRQREAEARAASEELDRGRPTRKQLESSIRTGRENASWYANHDCPGQAARIHERCDEWQRMIDRREYR